VSAPLASAARRRPTNADLVGLAALLLLLVVGLSWAKWLPYWDRTLSLVADAVWPSGAIFAAAGDSPSLAGAWDFTVAYTGGERTGALLVTLPALSVPSVVMVGKALGWRATTAMAAAVAVGGVVAGLLLAVLT
jgi:uncharacterized protein